MSIDQNSREIAVKVINQITPSEREALGKWLEDLLTIKNGQLSKVEKFKLVVLKTKKSAVIFPVIKMLFKGMKKHGWEDRGVKGRLAVTGMATGLLFFSGQSAGIAALGGAIGVPLWIVFGAGGAFAGVAIEEIKRRNAKASIVDYEVLDAEKRES